MMMENKAFTERCIAKLQGMSIEDGRFALALNDYLLRHERLFYDFGRNLFWVTPPSGKVQVAVWMMPVCVAAEGSC